MKTIHMKKAHWEKWDAALRSGEYRQGGGKLHNPENDSYCCLGVLQHCLNGAVEDRVTATYHLPSYEWLEEHGIRFFSKARHPLLVFGNTGLYAADANDSLTADGNHTYPFPMIADAIAEAVEFTDQ